MGFKGLLLKDSLKVDWVLMRLMQLLIQTLYLTIITLHNLIIHHLDVISDVAEAQFYLQNLYSFSKKQGKNLSHHKTRSGLIKNPDADYLVS